MNVLLAGGAGYIGSHVYLDLVNAGYNPVIVDNFSNSKEDVIRRLKHISKQNVQYEKVNICDYFSMRDVFIKYNPRIIIHLAGYKAVGESVSNPLKYYQNNIDSTLTLCRLMEEFSVNRMIFSSSATVYGQDNETPLTEKSSVGRCINPYGWTKYINEQVLRDFAKTQLQKKFVILRYFNPVGAHESGLIGEQPVGIPNNIMPNICQVAIGKEKLLKIWGGDYPTKDGTCIRDYLHVMDLANGHLAACCYEFDKSTSNYEVFNLGTGKGYSVLELINTFATVNGVAVPYEISARREGDLASCFADAGKANAVLGWTARRQLDRMCIDSWNWIKLNPNGYE